MRGRVAALAGVEPARAAPAPEVSTAGPEPLTPIEDVEELLELASLLLEGLDDPDEFERFVDGLSRLADVPVPRGRRTALLRRAKRGREASEGYVEKLCLAWFGVKAFPFFSWTGEPGAVNRRLAVVRRRLEARRPALLLSAPTHRGGFLAAETLHSRLEAGGAIEDDDLALALLRVPEGEAPSVPLPRTALPASWDSTDLLADPPPARQRVAPEPTSGFNARVSPARLLAAPAGGGTRARSSSRTLALVWPGRREHYYAGVVRPLPTRLTAALTTMLYPGEPLGPHAAHVIAVGLHEADANRLLAADVLADAFATRRIEPATLGAALARSRARASRHASRPRCSPSRCRNCSRRSRRCWPGSTCDAAADRRDRSAAADRPGHGHARERPAGACLLESLTAKSGKLARQALAV